MKYRILISLLLLIFVQLSLYSTQNLNSILDEGWKQFKSKFVKIYSNATHEEQRRKNWEAHFNYIENHNKNFYLGLQSFTVGINKFSDMSHEEFKSIYLSYNITAPVDNNTFSLGLQSVSLKTSVDWSEQGYVTPVKDQGECGSCWAFSAVGAIESQFYKANKKLIRLSEQQLVDCSTKNYGCAGGTMLLAFKYVNKTGGIQYESEYPYIAQPSSCKFDTRRAVATVTGYTIVNQNEISLASAVEKFGPISVGVDASLPSFQNYKNGVYSVSECSTTSLNHAMLLVGFGVTSDNIKYWKLKNSWGTSWGQSGYIFMAKDKGNQCGLASVASYPATPVTNIQLIETPLNLLMDVTSSSIKKSMKLSILTTSFIVFRHVLDLKAFD